MKQLTEIPDGYKPMLTNGESVLHLPSKDSDIAVMENLRLGVILELPTLSALARGYWEEVNLPEKTAMQVKAVRRQLIMEPYDPDARDGDNDGIVQEGTPWERPVGTRFLRPNGQPLRAGLEMADRPRSARLVDADGNDVDYTPTYDRPPAPHLGATIGQTSGTVRTRKGPSAVRQPTPKPSLVQKLKRKVLGGSLSSDDDGTELEERDFRSLVRNWHKKRVPKDYWETTVRVRGADGQIIEQKIDRRTASIPKMEDWEIQARDAKISTSHLIAKRMRENGFDLGAIFDRDKSRLMISKEGTLVIDGDLRDQELERSMQFLEVDKSDPKYDELFDEAVVGWLVHQWTLSHSMISRDSQRTLQNATRKHFGLKTEEYPNAFTGAKADVFEGFIQSMHEETQEMFKDAGITSVVLHRGSGLNILDTTPEEVLNPRTAPHLLLRESILEDLHGNRRQDLSLSDVPIELRSLSAFASEREITEDFGGEGDVRLVIRTTVPVERVLGTAATGIGTLGETEMVVIGPNEDSNDLVQVEWTFQMTDRIRQELREHIDAIETEGFDPKEEMKFFDPKAGELVAREDLIEHYIDRQHDARRKRQLEMHR